MSMTQIFNKIYQNSKTCCDDITAIRQYTEELEEENIQLKNKIISLEAKLKASHYTIDGQAKQILDFVYSDK